MLRSLVKHGMAMRRSLWYYSWCCELLYFWNISIVEELIPQGAMQVKTEGWVGGELESSSSDWQASICNSWVYGLSCFSMYLLVAQGPNFIISHRILHWNAWLQRPRTMEEGRNCTNSLECIANSYFHCQNDLRFIVGKHSLLKFSTLILERSLFHIR